ncbi:polyprenyl synthetase family protein [uncultured Anaerococcus sp.]|uniref:polyprenyl synthetase family protein n=1 Tax=uncultured Anaerococcus sp. TaxID=293428 RepID=UPI0025F0E986|nr:polyprenyl synthetase family protein [uncultured Anaerococcus sp.]
MTREKLLKEITNNKNTMDKKVLAYFNPQNLIEEAMLYASDGGKRIRAFLYLQSKKMFSGNLSDEDYSMALALELIHAYSLVHDDLPAMDNDDYRRGKESVHKKFGEDIGILTGDALLNEAALILMKLSNKNDSFHKAAIYVLKKASRSGMIYGQLLDLRRDKTYDIPYVLEVYSKKTSDLFKASCVAGAISSGVSEKTIKSIEEFADKLGLAFQIQDDLLEETYEDELNILNVMDKDEAIKLLDRINNEAKQSIENFDNNENLLSLVDYLSKRSY